MSLNHHFLNPNPQPQLDSKWNFGDSRIVGGEIAPEGRYPYTVSLIDTILDEHGCGGTLIAPDIILSAAHCSSYHDMAEIGRHDRSDPEDDYESFGILEEIIHPLYYNLSFGPDVPYDAMVIVLDGESSVEPVRINRDPSYPIDTSILTALGWGITDEYDFESSPVLREVSLNYVNNTICSEASSDYVWYDSYEGLITDDMMCAAAGGGGKDSCYGDSGGPLIVKGSDSQSDLQVGIVSWGYGCGDEDFPGVYSRVSYSAEWIDYIVCNNSKNPPSDFDCETASNFTPPTRPPVEQPTLPPVPAPLSPEDTINATITIEMDSYPTDIGWKVERLGRQVEEVVQVSPGFYKDPHATVEHTIPLHMGEVYSFSIIDILGDGVYGEGYSVVLSTGDDSSTAIEADGNFGYGSTHYFLASLESSVSGTPTTLQDGWHLLALELEFGSYPESVGYALVSYSGASSEARRSGLDSPYIAATKSPPFYHSSLANEVITEYILVPAVDADFTFILTDPEGGSFKLWNGPVEDNALLIDGSGNGDYPFRLTISSSQTTARGDSSSGPSMNKEVIPYVAALSSILLLGAM